METIGWFAARAWDIICITAGIGVFLWIVKNVRVKKIAKAIESIVKWITDKVNEMEEPEVKETEQKFEIHLTAKQIEELERMMNNKETFQL